MLDPLKLKAKQEMVHGKMTVGEVHQEIPKSIRSKSKIMLSAIWGSLIFFYLKLRFRAVIQAIKPLANHLEKQIFPELRKRRIGWLDIKPSISDNREKGVVGVGGHAELAFPGTRELYDFMRDREINHFIFSTHLEANQLFDVLLVFLFVFPHLKNPASHSGDYWTWDGKAIATAMRTEKGFHRFCADMMFLSKERIFKVDYTYCELFMSKLTKKYAGSFSKFSDHRAYFSSAPVVSVIFFVVFSLPSMLIYFDYQIWPLIWIPVIILPPILGWFIMHTLGAMQYDIEHNNLLLRESVRQEKVLARFPEINPNPIFKVTEEGKVLYVNPAASYLLADSNLDHNQIEKVLPSDYISLAKQCLTDQKPQDIELTYDEKVLRYLVSPFPEDRTVLFAGSDVTYLRTVEKELRHINTNLETLVEKKTSELQTTQDATILCLSGLAEVRDPETGAHIQRTRLYVKILATKLKKHPRFRDQLNDKAIDLIYKSAPLHDIGKVAIPDNILLKQGKLDKAEFEIMKRHALYGAQALQAAVDQLGFDSYLNIACEIASYHHERWDGTGYPAGLKGDEIPLSAKLMALADVYDALINKRVYKSTFSYEKAKSVILEGKGVHFDPHVVDAFVSVEAEFKRIAGRFPDKE